MLIGEGVLRGGLVGEASHTQLTHLEDRRQ